MFFKTTDIDEKWHPWKDEGIYPQAMGTYHMYHRIDGKLVAFGVIDICRRFFNSAYFVYDPDYKFLNLGVVGAIREMEYMRMVKKRFNSELHFYQLGEMVPCCPKVNYKMNYQPGMVICPRTKRDIWWADVQDQAKILEQLPIAEKQEYPWVQLDPEASDAPLPEEMLVNILADKVDDMTFLYEDRRHVRFVNLQEAGKKHIYPFVLQLLSYAGLQFFQRVLFELKWAPKDRAESSDEEKPSFEEKVKKMVKSEEQPKADQILSLLLVDHFADFVRLTSSQTQQLQESQNDILVHQADLDMKGFDLEEQSENKVKIKAKVDQIDEDTKYVLAVVLFENLKSYQFETKEEKSNDQPENNSHTNSEEKKENGESQKNESHENVGEQKENSS